MIEQYLTGDKNNILNLRNLTDRDDLEEIAQEINERLDIIEFIAPLSGFKERDIEKDKITSIEYCIDKNYKAELLKKICQNDPELKEANFSFGYVSRNTKMVYQSSDLSNTQWKELIEGLKTNTHLQVLILNDLNVLKDERWEFFFPLAKAIGKNEFLSCEMAGASKTFRNACLTSRIIKVMESYPWAQYSDEVIQNCEHSLSPTLRLSCSICPPKKPPGEITEKLSLEEIEERIKKCTSLNELKDILNNIGEIPVSDNKAPLAGFIYAKNIENFLHGEELNVNIFTRAADIRVIVANLYKNKRFLKPETEASVRYISSKDEEGAYIKPFRL